MLSHTRKHMYCFDKESRGGRDGGGGGEIARVAESCTARESPRETRGLARGEVSQDEKGAE